MSKMYELRGKMSGNLKKRKTYHNDVIKVDKVGNMLI